MRPFQFFGSLNFSKKERIAPIKSNRQEIVDFFQKLKTRDLQLGYCTNQAWLYYINSAFLTGTVQSKCVGVKYTPKKILSEKDNQDTQKSR